MTLQELAALPREYLKPIEIAPVLGWMPYVANVKAKEGTLPFPAMFSGNRLKIPKRPFLQYMGYNQEHECDNPLREQAAQ